MLKNIKLHNFKNHKDTAISLDDSRMHALVGHNNSGKTSMLQALYYLGLLVDFSFDQIFRDEASPQFIVRMEEKQMSVCVNGFLEKDSQKHWEASYSWHKQDSVNSKNLWEHEHQKYWWEGGFCWHDRHDDCWFPELSWKIQHFPML